MTLTLGWAVALVAALSHASGVLSTAQLQSYDFVFRARAEERARATVIVGIDDRTYQELLPVFGPPVEWPRTLFARGVDVLSQAGARVIMFDAIYGAPQPEDAEFAAAISRAQNVVLAVEAEQPRALSPRPGITQEFGALSGSSPALRAAAAAEGLANVTTDRDLAVRSLPLVLTVGDRDHAALPLVVIARYLRRPAVLDAPPTDSHVYAVGRTIPLVSGSRMLINFMGPPSGRGRPGPYEIVPFVEVLQGTFDPELVRDKIVLFGVTMRGVDELTTASTFILRMWGVEVLGTAIETILNQRFLVYASPALTIGTLFLFATATALLVVALRPFIAVTLTIGGIVLYFLLAIFLVDAGLLLNLIYPPAALLLTLGVTLTYRVVFEQTQQRRLRATMDRYLAPSVSDWAMHDPQRLKLGGEGRVMSVLFADVRGFTALAESLPAEELTEILNEYMTEMTEVVFDGKGVLDKYIGDAIMAFWNAPLDQADHASLACDASLGMIRRLDELQGEWHERWRKTLDLGIGINTGHMVVGNMGSRHRIEYTVLGDSVNVASRLEGLTKEYKVRIMVGEETKAATDGRFLFRFLDDVIVSGREAPLGVYELLGRVVEVSADQAAFVERYHLGVAAYRDRRWEEAAAMFRGLVASAPGDGPSALYLTRSEVLMALPPGHDWTPVFRATGK